MQRRNVFGYRIQQLILFAFLTSSNRISNDLPTVRTGCPSGKSERPIICSKNSTTFRMNPHFYHWIALYIAPRSIWSNGRPTSRRRKRGRAGCEQWQLREATDSFIERDLGCAMAGAMAGAEYVGFLTRDRGFEHDAVAPQGKPLSRPSTAHSLLGASISIASKWHHGLS